MPNPFSSTRSGSVRSLANIQDRTSGDRKVDKSETFGTSRSSSSSVTSTALLTEKDDGLKRNRRTKVLKKPPKNFGGGKLGP